MSHKKIFEDPFWRNMELQFADLDEPATKTTEKPKASLPLEPEKKLGHLATEEAVDEALAMFDRGMPLSDYHLSLLNLAGEDHLLDYEQ